jgi:DNA polymerase V
MNLTFMERPMNMAKGLNDINLDPCELLEEPGSYCALVVNTDILWEAGIQKGDQVVVDRSRQPLNGNIVIAKIGDDLCLRKILIEEGRKTLLTPGTSLAPLSGEHLFYFWGVVIYVLKKML